MSEQLTGKAKRTYYLDVLRTLAILSISMNHAVNRSYQNFSYSFFEFRQIPLWSSFVKVIAIVFGHIGVPLFLMISGALLLNKTIDSGEDVKRFYKHNLLPLFITTELWYAILYCFILAFHTDHATITVGSFAGGFVSTLLMVNQTTMDSMWYMPMILTLYLLVPYAAMIVRRIPFRLIALPCLLLYVSDLVFPTVNDVLRLQNIDMYLNFVPRGGNLFSIYFLFMLAGWWTARGGLQRLRGRYIALGLLLTFLFCCVFQFYAYSRPAQATFDYNFALLPLLSMLIFELGRRAAHLLQRFERPITYIAKISFAIYFVHIVIMSLLEWYFPYRSWSKPVAMLFLEVVSILGSILIIRILSMIPWCKKYLFMIKG